MTKYEDKLGRFAERLKSEPIQPPLQEVKPIKNKANQKPETEVQLNIWIPKSLMKKIKQESLDSDLSIKEWVTDALNKLLY